MLMKEGLEEKRSYAALWSLLAGGVVGAGIGLMLAPKSGKDLRKDIVDVSERGINKVASAIEEGRRLFHRSRGAVTSAIDCGKTAFEGKTLSQQKAA